MNALKRMCGMNTPERVVQQDLADAKLELLQAQYNKEHWEGVEATLQKRIKRLSDLAKENASTMTADITPKLEVVQ